MLAGLCLCLMAGCASSPTQNRKVYDRYAELVAARTRAVTAPASKAPETTEGKPTKDTAKTESNAVGNPSVKSMPHIREEPTTKVAPLAPVAVLDPLPASQPVPAPAVPAVPPAPPPAPAQPAPVQVMEPAPAISVPVQSVPAPVPAPEVLPPVAPVAAAYPAAASSTDGVAYLLKVGDVIQIFLRGIPTSDAIEDVIDENGNVSLPLINEVRAAGMTAAELERNIRGIYLDQDIYRNIAVTVVVPTRYYFIQGEIRGPGRFQLVSATRVSQAIAGAGGYTEYANGQVVVKRGGKIVKTIRNAKRLERTPEDDVLLEPDDIIEVKRSLW